MANLNMNVANTIKESELIYEIGDDISSVSLILSGTVSATNDNGTIEYNAGDTIGCIELYSGFYSADYIAKTEVSLLPIACTGAEDFPNAIKDNSSLVVNNSSHFTRLTKVLALAYDTFYNDIAAYYETISSLYAKLNDICSQNLIICGDYMAPPSADNFKLSNLEVFGDLKAMKSVSDVSRVVADFFTAYEDLSYYLETLIQSVTGKTSGCFTELLIGVSSHISEASRDELLSIISELDKASNDLEISVRNHTNISIDFDFGRIRLCKNIAATADNSMVEDDNILSASNSLNAGFSAAFEASPLIDTFEKLTDYAGYTEEETTVFSELIENFKKLSDKSSGDDSARRLRKGISDEFFKLYERVFLKYAEAPTDELFVDMFLNYGLLDETLIEEDKLLPIINKASEPTGSPCLVYHMTDWLMSIYDGTNMPSKNEFDEEYIDYVRKKKKELHLTPEQERMLLENGKLKVQYEINNMFKCNDRLLSGNPSCFYPMLNSFSVEQSLIANKLDADKINSTLTDLLKLDYSAFYRESLYEDLSKGITKEPIVKEVFPIIVLFPVYGSMCSMWQEVSGKRINNPGRVFMPSFFTGDFSLAIMRLVGRYRWELCKTAQGLAWNDVSVPSLTSEYTDYLQFYRNNKELSPEKREVIKTQLQRCRNNIREAFIVDYITWIKYESAGAVRLNKVSRRIMATYCPLSKEYRTKLDAQPIFNEAMQKYQREKAKKIKDISMRLANLTKKGIELTEELLTTETYYKDL